MKDPVIAKKTIIVVSLINAITNTLLAVLKVFIGFFGHSQALIADGIHSFSDLISDALVFFAARASTDCPDKEHPYGHQRIETIATIIIALILFSVAIALFDEAILRLTHHLFKKPSVYVVIIAAVSIIANECLFRYTKKQGEKINSNLLISNAWHKRSDAFVSLIVLFSVVGALFGLTWFDAVGTIIIAILIIKMAFKMIWRSTQELIDRGVDDDTLNEMKDIINHVSGVVSIHQLRTRLHGNSIFLDLHIIVDPFITVSEGHHIGDEVHLKLLQKIKNLYDVTVHVDPENDETTRPSLNLPNREKVLGVLEARSGELSHYSNIKKINLHYAAGHLIIDIVMPLSVLDNITAEKLLVEYQKALHDVADLQNIVIYYV